MLTGERTLEEVVGAVQDSARCDAEVVAVLAHLVRTRQLAFEKSRRCVEPAVASAATSAGE